MKKNTSLFLSLVLALSLAGCGTGSGDEKKDSEPSPGSSADSEPVKTDDPGKQEETPVVMNVNLREILDELHVNDEKLGIAGKYKEFSDITDGKIDPELIGTWTIAGGTATYTYREDGKFSAVSADYGNNENIPYTCMKIGGYNIVFEEVGYTEDSEEADETVVTMTSYKIINDVLYMTSVEDLESEYQFYSSPIQVMYREDASGSIKAAFEKNPISAASYDGVWTDGNETEITIRDGILTANGQEYKLSMNDQNQLVAEKDGESTAYPVSLVYSVIYDEGKIDSEGYIFSFYYVGKDENDKPNLYDVMVDWHKEYDWSEFRYNGTFREKEE